MISRAQQILLKRAAKEAGLSDPDYRDALALVSGCRSSADPKLTDRGVDLALAYFEAIHWRKVDAGELPPPCSPGAVFHQRSYWKQKNPSGNTSRDRYNSGHVAQPVADLEQSLKQLGCGPGYCAAIRAKVGTNDYAYMAALRRTIAAKLKTIKTLPAQQDFGDLSSG